MEQTIQNNVATVAKSVKIRQNIAAGLLVLTNIYWMYRIIFPVTPEIDALCNLIVGVTSIAAWTLLCTTASNKATRVASNIIITFSLIATVLKLTIIGNPALSTYIYIFQIINPLSSIYAYSILLKGNSNISTNDRSWLGFLILASIGNVIINLVFMGFGYIFPGRDYDFMRQYAFYISISWVIWNLAFYCLILVAEFRTAKCAAFEGNYTSEAAPKGTYSPLNKYFAATLISIPIVIGLLWVVYNNLEFLDSIF